MTDIAAIAKGLTGAIRRWLGIRRGPDWTSAGATYNDAFRIMGRKSLWMVEYLRARRSGDTLRGFYRTQFLRQRRSHLKGQE